MFIVAEDDVSRLERQTLYRVSQKKVPSIEMLLSTEFYATGN